MFKLIRKAPWVALGAVAVYYADSENGPARRESAADRVKALANKVKGEARGAAVDVRENDDVVRSGATITPSAPVEPTAPTKPVGLAKPTKAAEPTEPLRSGALGHV